MNAIIIMDGFGKPENIKDSAIMAGNTKNITKLMKNYPSTYIGASGMDVGLPEGQMGNSEVGHLNIGAGRVVYQELTRLTKSIKDGDFFTNEAIKNAIEFAKKNGGKLHAMGLLSNGGVHSHNTHLYALIDAAKAQGLDNIYIHCFMDGRDVSPTSGVEFVKELFAYTQKVQFGKIATITGRYYAMDRDNRWDRVEQAYNAIANGIGEKSVCGKDLMLSSYESGITDEFIKPTVICELGEPVATVNDGDAIVFFNFRPDRAREISRCFIQKDFDGFKRDKQLDVKFVCFTQYDASFTDTAKFSNVEVSFKPSSMDNTLGEYLASNGLKQFRIAETEKYAHVTFFFNGGVEQPNDGEDRILISSPKVATYDLQPEMSAYEVCEKAIVNINSNKYDVMILNFANCDMVGHTGIFSAAEKAVQAVDECVGKVVDCILNAKGTVLITADHGNADKMYEDDGSPFTAHTTSPVPFILVGEKYKNAKLRDNGILADIAPTLLDIIGLPKPAEMTGSSLIK